MTGGLMNLTAVGNENIILNGNQKKHFSKQLIISLQTLVCKNLE